MKTNRMQWLRFFKLSPWEEFFFGSRRYTKTSWFGAHAVLDGAWAFVEPWTKVRSARPYGKAAFKPAIVPPAISTAPGALSVVAPPSAHTEQVAGEEKP